MSEGRYRYTADMDLRNVNDAHTLAIGRVPPGSRVLDLGAADGSVAEVLGAMGCQVWGVERDPEAAKQALRFCEGVHVVDLDTVDLEKEFADQRFDVVLMLDVLEHLVDPARMLRGVARVLTASGWGVVSLPNVAHISLRLELLDGKFTYRDLGLLDRTHLRFFDIRGVEGLLDEAGWGSFELTRVKRELGSTEVDVAPPNPELLHRIEADAEAYTYQFVVCAAPLGSSVHSSPPLLPAAIAQQVALDLTFYAQHLRGEVEELRSRLHLAGKGGLLDLSEQLEGIRRSSVDRRRQLTNLLEALKEDTERLRGALSE